MNVAKEKNDLEQILPHMGLTDALDQRGVGRGDIVIVEYHYLGALDTTWLKVRRQSNGHEQVARILKPSGPPLKVEGQEINVLGRKTQLESWFNPEALKLGNRFTGRVKHT